MQFISQNKLFEKSTIAELPSKPFNLVYKAVQSKRPYLHVLRTPQIANYPRTGFQFLSCSFHCRYPYRDRLVVKIAGSFCCVNLLHLSILTQLSYLTIANNDMDLRSVNNIYDCVAYFSSNLVETATILY